MKKDWQHVATSALTLQMVFADGGEKTCSNAYSLPFWHNDKSCGSVGMGCKQWCHGQMAHWLTIDEADKVLGRYRHSKV